MSHSEYEDQFNFRGSTGYLIMCPLKGKEFKRFAKIVKTKLKIEYKIKRISKKKNKMLDIMLEHQKKLTVVEDKLKVIHKNYNQKYIEE